MKGMGESPAYYPIFLDLNGRKCVVVGGGTVGERKVRGLLEGQARVVVVSPDVTPGLAKLVREGQIEWIKRSFVPGDLSECVLAFAATDDEAVNQAVVRAARAAGIPANSAQTGGDFLVPATFRRGALQVGISSGGTSPAYARLVREQLEGLFGPEHGELLAWLGNLRGRIQEEFPEDAQKRRAFWKKIVTWSTVELVSQAKWDQVEEKVRACLLSLSD